jgi:hypothetical protein
MLLGRLQFDDEVLAWVREALHASHGDERREHEEAIRRLQGEPGSSAAASTPCMSTSSMGAWTARSSTRCPPLSTRLRSRHSNLSMARASWSLSPPVMRRLRRSSSPLRQKPIKSRLFHRAVRRFPLHSFSLTLRDAARRPRCGASKGADWRKYRIRASWCVTNRHNKRTGSLNCQEVRWWWSERHIRDCA